MQFVESLWIRRNTATRSSRTGGSRASRPSTSTRTGSIRYGRPATTTPRWARVCARDARRRVGPRSRRYHRDRRRVPGRARRARRRPAGSTTPLGYVAFAVRDPDQSVVDAARSYTVARRRTNVFPIVYDCEAETLHRHEIPRLKGRGSTAETGKRRRAAVRYLKVVRRGSPAQIRRPAIRPAPSAAAVAGVVGETTSTSRSSSAESRFSNSSVSPGMQAIPPVAAMGRPSASW